MGGRERFEFKDRLIQAASRAGVGTTQAEIAEALGVGRQRVYAWFNGHQPRGDVLVDIARRFDVSAAWLQTGEGDMVSDPAGSDLSTDERELIRNYRTATPKVREVISTMARAVRKSILVIAACIPPFLAGAPEAQAAQFSIISDRVHLGFRRWLQRIVEAMKLRIAVRDFLTAAA